jgi:spore germination protein KB
MEKISKHQLFCLVMMGQIGSTNLWALGIEAKRDAWIVILFSLLVSCGLVWLFTELQKYYPQDTLAGLLTSLLGKVIGWPLALLYALVYIFNVTRNVSEFGVLINMTFLQSTPKSVIMVILLAIIIYILFLGIETFARLTEIIMPAVLILIILIYIMVIASGRVNLKQLTPVFENGIMPILKASYPVGINFPFGLVFVFMQIWHYTQPKEAIRKTTYFAVIISGLILSFTMIFMVATLGTNFAADATVPFLEIIKLINIGKILTNLDAIGVIMIFIGGLYLAILFFYSASVILSALFKIKNFRWVMIPLGIFILWYANVYEPNYPTHIKYLVPQYWQQFVPLHNIIPILLLLIFGLKKYCGKSIKSGR